MTRVVLMTVGTLMLLLGTVSMVSPIPGGTFLLAGGSSCAGKPPHANRLMRACPEYAPHAAEVEITAAILARRQVAEVWTNKCGLAGSSNCSGLPPKKTPPTVHRERNPQWLMHPRSVGQRQNCRRGKRPQQVYASDSEPARHDRNVAIPTMSSTTVAGSGTGLKPKLFTYAGLPPDSSNL